MTSHPAARRLRSNQCQDSGCPSATLRHFANGAVELRRPVGEVLLRCDPVHSLLVYSDWVRS